MAFLCLYDINVIQEYNPTPSLFNRIFIVLCLSNVSSALGLDSSFLARTLYNAILSICPSAVLLILIIQSRWCLISILASECLSLKTPYAYLSHKNTCDRFQRLGVSTFGGKHFFFSAYHNNQSCFLLLEQLLSVKMYSKHLSIRNI